MRAEYPRLRQWARRVGIAIATIAIVPLGIMLYGRARERPESAALVTSVDGPPLSNAAGVVVFLHGLGGGLSDAEGFAHRLREAGLPPDYAIVLVEAPYAAGLGYSWGFTQEAQATSRARLRAQLREVLGASPLPPARIVVSGFSQGAGMAIDTAVEEPRIGAIASFSPCRSWLRGDLPKRTRDPHAPLRVLLSHGTRDTRCPIEESRSLARALADAHAPAQYVEFDGAHTVPPDVVRALVLFATAEERATLPTDGCVDCGTR